MKRRELLKLGAGSLMAVTAGRCGPLSGLLRPPEDGIPADGTLDLTVTEALVEMVDGQSVYHWVWAEPTLGPSFPGPVLLWPEGYVLTLTVTNTLDEDHAFAVIGGPDAAIVPGTDTGPIPPGGTATITFAIPAAGTYMYVDPLNAPVNRVLGLHGALISTPVSGNTPYSSPTDSVQQLFDDLGTAPQFPKHALTPAGWQQDRSRIWFMSQVDPAFNALAENGATIDPADIRANFLPRYFTINGKSGVFASHDHDTTIDGRIGQPMLVRILNAGLFTHSNHLHANHFYVTAVNNVVRDNVLFLDSYHIFPEDRVDWLVPFIRPPDIAGDQSIQLRDLIPNELALVLGGVPQSPLPYPMHCHMEPSQTAAGGNYPQGATVHFEFLGDVDGVDFSDHLAATGSSPPVPGGLGGGDSAHNH